MFEVASGPPEVEECSGGSDGLMNLLFGGPPEVARLSSNSGEDSEVKGR